MAKRTPLYDQHVTAGARLVDFAGWDMPVNYGSQIDEHHKVRQDAGMFDVSHMLALDIVGEGATPFLRRLLANDVARLQDYGKAMYSCMLNPDGGVIDDLIVYRLADVRYRMVVNAGTADGDVAWMQEQAAGFEVNLHPRRDLAIIAAQGPNARIKVLHLLRSADHDQAQALLPFHGVELDDWFLGRTGYTGEDGFEIMLPGEEAAGLWQRMLEAGVAPCGLGARDTLRLEAGMNLYGQDMDENTSPLESGLGWTVAWNPEDRDFVGRAALEPQRGKAERKLVGLVLEAKGVLRAHQPVLAEGEPVGELTSGTFSPTLGLAIGLARVGAQVGERVEVDIRGKRFPARVVKPPFVRNGKALI